MRVERYAGDDRAVVDAWIDRVTFAAIGVVGLLGAGLLLVAAALVDNDNDFATTFQVFGFFGIVITSVIQMRVVAQILRRDDSSRRRPPGLTPGGCSATAGQVTIRPTHSDPGSPGARLRPRHQRRGSRRSEGRRWTGPAPARRRRCGRRCHATGT